MTKLKNLYISNNWRKSLLSFLSGLVGLVSSTTDAVEFTKILRFPKDVKVEVFSDEVLSARHMAFDDQGVLFLSQTRKGQVTALPDKNLDGKMDRLAIILDNLRAPHGLAFAQLNSGYYLFVAEENQIVRTKRIAKPFEYGPPEVFINDIPVGGHFTRTIKIYGGKLYLSVGSSCNVCEETNAFRAAVSRFGIKNGGHEIFAQGLRNTVGLEFSPYTGKLWGVNNGRDMMGDDFPREELNIIEKGKHYGWPYCHNDRIPDPKFGGKMDCSKTIAPAYTFTAHMAPLGLEFYQRGSLPSRFNHSLFIAFHGSWNRSVPAGYKIVRVVLNASGEIQSHEDFITGFLRPGGKKIGRPVDVEQSPDGALYISDDYSGSIYRVTASKDR